MKKLLILTICFFASISVNGFQSITETATKVGINNIDPVAPLHIGDGTNSDDVRIDGDQVKLRFLTHAPSQSAWIQWGSDWLSGSTTDLHFSGIFGQPFIMTLNGDGNVGVGNNNPSAKLDVKHGHIRCLNTSSTGGAIMQSMYAPETGYARAIFSHNVYWDTNTKKWDIQGMGANDAQAILIRNQGGFNFIIHKPEGNFSKELTNVDFVAGTKMMLTKDGNLSIGTMNPGIFKLAVNGNVRAKEVKVETGWSDFVFEDDYDLPTLEEVEKFIDVHKHLPEIPSAKEVEENGVNLGEMDSKLLQKIEELTLYVIEQNKKIRALENKNKILEKRVKRLEK